MATNNWTRRRVASAFQAIIVALSGTACTTFGELEQQLQSRETPTYAVMSGNPTLVPGVATSLPARIIDIVPSSIFLLNTCGFSVQRGQPISNYEADTLSGGPLFSGIFWFPSHDRETFTTKHELFSVLRRVAGNGNVVRLRFFNSVLIRFDEPETFVHFLDDHPGVTVNELSRLVAPCVTEITKHDYRIVSHLILADVEIQFRWLFFPIQLSKRDLHSEDIAFLQLNGLQVDEKAGTIKSIWPMRVARFGQLRLNGLGRFGPASPSKAHD